MRLRNVRGSEEIISAHPFTIQTDGADAEQFKGNWQKEIFGNFNPIHLEIGMGKGQFLIKMAALHPEINFIGIEKYSSVLVRAVEKLDALKLGNIRFLRMDAEDLEDFFSAGEIEKIYLNFSDPWPKVRHAKRRLTSAHFLEKYEYILVKNGLIQFKTDNRPLFDFSLEQLEKTGWYQEEVSFHLHENGPAENNVMTEYEEKFYRSGNPICRFLARKPN
ncbi:MAG: tRNA (guanosine(46)-N7)-methyltransferase TrmB [Lachnospiraceae bacterium]|nr:tRNA (guanosine(46)-N7)-methyltransferase TrmB [Lachnospiraceae bacterium]